MGVLGKSDSTHELTLCYANAQSTIYVDIFQITKWVQRVLLVEAKIITIWMAFADPCGNVKKTICLVQALALILLTQRGLSTLPVR